MKRPENAWLPAVLDALVIFPEALLLVRRTILRLCGYSADEVEDLVCGELQPAPA
jgi:hypothetical protein